MPSLAILVPSCDAYHDLWTPFFQLFRRHWPDCPYKLYVGAGSVACTEPGVTPIVIGDDADWSSSLRAMLLAMPETHVLIALEDFLLYEPVNTHRIQKLFESLVALDGAYLRLRPFPPPDVRLVRHPDVGEIDLGAPYRASMQAAIWHKQSLLDLLCDGESPWVFEHLGARRSDAFSRGFYSTWTPALHFYAAVVQGKWIPYGIALCREHGATVDLNARATLTPRETAARALNRVLVDAVDAIPWRTREAMLRWFRATGLRTPRPIPTRAHPPTKR